MARYSGIGAAAAGTSKTILTLIAATTKRGRLAELLLGCVATPADNATKFYLQRFTAVGTEGSGFTPIAADPAEPAALLDYGVGAFSVEPTYTANAVLLQISLNQRNTLRWIAAPGAELVVPATSGNGIGLLSVSSGSTQTQEATMGHDE